MQVKTRRYLKKETIIYRLDIDGAPDSLYNKFRGYNLFAFGFNIS